MPWAKLSNGIVLRAQERTYLAVMPQYHLAFHHQLIGHPAVMIEIDQPKAKSSSKGIELSRFCILSFCQRLLLSGYICVPEVNQMEKGSEHPQLSQRRTMKYLLHLRSCWAPVPFYLHTCSKLEVSQWVEATT